MCLEMTVSPRFCQPNVDVSSFPSRLFYRLYRKKRLQLLYSVCARECVCMWEREKGSARRSLKGQWALFLVEKDYSSIWSIFHAVTLFSSENVLPALSHLVAKLITRITLNEKKNWMLSISFVERGPQDEIPFRKGTAAFCRTEWRRDSRQCRHHQGSWS